MPTLQLVGTPLSHFARKNRVLFAELGVAYEFVRLASVLADSPSAFADNPLMRVPTLVCGNDTVIDSDHIARYVVNAFDPADRFGVRSERVEDLNRLAVLNGVMANEVVLILAKRTGVEDPSRIAYFRKLSAAIEGGLAWLDERATLDDNFDYRDITTVCMWQHLRHYKLVPLDGYPRLAARVAKFADRPSVASTTPEAAVAEATAAGWKPA